MYTQVQLINKNIGRRLVFGLTPAKCLVSALFYMELDAMQVLFWQYRLRYDLCVVIVGVHLFP